MKRTLFLVLLLGFQPIALASDLDWGIIGPAVGMGLGLKAVNKYVFKEQPAQRQYTEVVQQPQYYQYPTIQQSQPIHVDYYQVPQTSQYQAPPPVYLSNPSYTQRINPYTRSDGTPVSGYYRTRPDGYKFNNFSSY